MKNTYTAENVQAEIDQAQLQLDNALMDMMQNENEFSEEAAEILTERSENAVAAGLHLKHEFRFGVSKIYLNMNDISALFSAELDKMFTKHMTKAGFKHTDGVFTK